MHFDLTSDIYSFKRERERERERDCVVLKKYLFCIKKYLLIYLFLIMKFMGKLV